MSDPYVLTILVTSGDPEGVRVVEVELVGPRRFKCADLGVANGHGISSPGIYVLVGEDPDGTFTNGSMSVRVKRSEAVDSTPTRRVQRFLERNGRIRFEGRWA